MGKLFKSFILLAGISLLLAGCAKEESLTSAELGGEQTTVTFTASMDNGTVTKAVADGDGAAASVNRCIMEIYYDGSLFARQYQPVNSMKATFTCQVVANRTYTVAFWADCVAQAGDTPTAAELEVDQYYTTKTDTDNKGLQAIALKGDYVGNNDARDAFFHCGSYTVAQNGSAWSDIKLYRPFAQVNVITTDVATVATVEALKPENVNLTINNAYTSFNVVEGVAGTTANLTYNTAIYKWDATKAEATLSMDYLFASADKAVIDIDWKATKANNADVSHAFSNIPYQRNYRTNIKGALLTTTGEWTVTVDPVWESSKEGKEEYNVYCTNVSNGVDVKGAVNDKKGDSTKDGQGISVTIDQGLGTSTVNDDIIIPDNTPEEKTPEIILDFKTLAADAQIIIRDENHPRDAQEATSGAIEYTGEVVVIVPDGTTADQVKILTDKSTVTVRGQYGNVIASCAPQTIIVSKGSVVCTLSVVKGNVDLYGQVTSIERASGNTSDITVNVYDGAVWTNWESEKASTGIKPTVHLGTYTFNPKGYNVAGSTVFANTGSSPATWTVSVTNEWQYYAAESFSNVSGTTITIMNAAELALFSKDITTYSGYNVVLGTDIDLSAHEWNPIASFTKTFDGNNRTISGMTVNGSLHQGLFASLNGADVLDLTISGANVTSTITSGEDSRCGVLAGEVSSGSITNVKVRNSNITADGQYVGAIFGIGYSEVDGCEVSGCNITGTEQVGAALGYMWVGYIQNCTVTGNTIHATSQRAGGLVGKVQFASGNMGSSTMWIKDNTISGTITAETANTVGGIAGQIMGDCDKYEISGNSIDAAGTNCPIGTLRASQSSSFTSVLAEKIHDNTWTTATLDANRYTYTNEQTGVGDQIIWNGSKPSPGTVSVANVAQFTDAVSNFNAAEVSGTYTVELAEGTYPMGDIIITQTSGKHLVITAADAADVAISYSGSNDYVFKVESNSNYKTDANIQFKGLKFSTGSTPAFTTGQAETRYVNDIDFINCEFTTDAGATPVTSPNNSQPSGLYFEKCTVTDGSGYLYSGYGNNSSDARKYAVKAVNCTATNCKHFINAQNNGTVIVENCTVSLSTGDYAVRTNAGNITVSNSSFTSTFVSSEGTPEVCGLLVVRKGNATVTVDQATTFSHSQAYIHDVQAADASTTVTIAGRVSTSITNTTYDFNN